MEPFWPDLAEEACGKIQEAFQALNKAPGHSAIFQEAQARLNDAYFVLRNAATLREQS